MEKGKALLLVVTLLLAIPALAYEDEVETVFHQVAQLMSIKVKEDIPRPLIRLLEDVPPSDFSELVNLDTGGKVFSAYVPEVNTIFLVEWKREVLAHEFAHYFQVKYRGMKPDERDTAEREAVWVQSHFR